MITKALWEDFDKTLKYKNAKGQYVYSDNVIIFILLTNVFCTPFVLALDILISPFELVCLLLLKTVKKKRGVE